MRNSSIRAASATTVIAAALSIAMLGAPAAVADTTNVIELSEEDLAYFHSAADRFGVDEDVQETLLVKVRAGIPLDSSTGAEPVSVVSSEVDGFYRTVETFADGSVIGSDMEIGQEAPADTSARGVLGCITGNSAGVYYGSDCWVYTSGLTIGASFYANYSRWSGGTSVSNWHTPAINVIGGSVTSQQWIHSPGTTSYIQLQFNSQTGGVLTMGHWVRFNVTTGGVSQTRGGVW